MDVTETIRTFFEFFGERGHSLVPGSSLVPPGGDPVLFTTAGMHPLTRYLEGRPHPQGRRLAGVQRCLRTTDLDEVGDDRHLTVFQMLGSWSLGDYDGPQSLRWGLELLTDRLGVGRDRLHATVFGGDEQVGPDLGSWQTWTELGVPVEQLGRTTGGPTARPARAARPLPQRSVDTGMGLERLLMVLQDPPSVYGCDNFQPWRTALTRLWQPDQRPLRLLADHLRSSIVIIGNGVTPSNTGRGYVSAAPGARSRCCGAPTAPGRWMTCRRRWSSRRWRSSAKTRKAARSRRCSAARNAGSPGCSPAAAG